MKRTTGRKSAFKPQRSTPGRCSTASDRPRVVAAVSREPATETTSRTSLRVICQYTAHRTHTPTWGLAPRLSGAKRTCCRVITRDGFAPWVRTTKEGLKTWHDMYPLPHLPCCRLAALCTVRALRAVKAKGTSLLGRAAPSCQNFLYTAPAVLCLRALHASCPPPHLPCCPACCTPPRRHTCTPLLLVRPLARARHVEGAQRHAGPRVQSAPRAQGEAAALLSTARSTEWAARAAALVWAVEECAVRAGK
jgi:hypothetical protein